MLGKLQVHSRVILIGTNANIYMHSHAAAAAQRIKYCRYRSRASNNAQIRLEYTQAGDLYAYIHMHTDKRVANTS